MSKFIYQSPGRYVQGKGIVSSIAEETERLGSHALIIADEVVWNITEEKIKESFSANNNVDFEYEVFKGESSEEEIQRIAKQYKEKNIDVVIGLGGGKALDTGKAVAFELKASVIDFASQHQWMHQQQQYLLFITKMDHLVVMNSTLKTLIQLS